MLLNLLNLNNNFDLLISLIRDGEVALQDFNDSNLLLYLCITISRFNRLLHNCVDSYNKLISLLDHVI